MIEGKIRKALNIGKIILDVLYPSVCPFCNDILDITERENMVCDECSRNLPYIHSPRCMKCGKQIESDEVEFCYDCSSKTHLYFQGCGLWSYSEMTKHSIHNFKYKNKRCYGEFYGKEMAQQLGDIIHLWNADVLVPVPLHKSRLKERGYNQANILAYELSKYIGIPVDKELIIRNKNTVPQKELDDFERAKNVENAFKIVKNVVQYKKVILIDDIYTTGTTIDACARKLLASGVMKVYYISLCIGHGF